MGFLDTLKTIFGASAPQDSPVKQSETNQPEPSASKPADAGLPPAAQRRTQLLTFVVSRLRAYQNEPDAAPTGIRLSIACANQTEEETYAVALWTTQPGRFQQELTRLLADNYIDLPKNWRFESRFVATVPPNCTYREENLGLTILDASKPDGPPRLASVTALVGQTEQPEYRLDPTQKTSFCIGRGHTAQTASGRVRTNDIVLLNETDPGFDPQQGMGNKAVSRAHATIRYDVAQQRYSLLVDAGGLPASGNKTKIMHPDNRIERADIAGMGYPLNDGDQIELGGEVTLLFSLQ